MAEKHGDLLRLQKGLISESPLSPFRQPEEQIDRAWEQNYREGPEPTRKVPWGPMQHNVLSMPSIPLNPAAGSERILLIGCAPYFTPPYIPFTARIWCLWGVGENGNASATKYTRVEMRYGTLTDYSVLGQLDTYSGYAATAVIAASAFFPIRGDKILFAAIKRVSSGGTGSRDFTGQPMGMGVDIIGERFA